MEEEAIKKDYRYKRDYTPDTEELKRIYKEMVERNHGKQSK